MKNVIKYLSVVIIATSLVSLPATAKEIDRGKQRTEIKSEKKYQCRLISRADAISRAKKRYKGKVVGVQFNDKGERSVYRVRMLFENKRVKTVSIKACR